MISTPEILRGGIRLPRTAPPRERDTFLKLLYHVDPEAFDGFGFEGVILKPGLVVTASELRPDHRFPETPVVLEYLPGPAYGSPRRRDQVYILWRYDAPRDAWCEMGRAASYSWEWAVDLRPLAVRALKEARSIVEIEHFTNVPVIANRIVSILDRELKPLDPRDRIRVVAVLHDRFAARLAS